MPKPKPEVDARALVQAATDIKGVEKAIATVMALKTPAAFASVFDLAIDPPKMSFPVGITYLAINALDRARKKHPEARDLVVARCAKAPVDDEVWKLPIQLLAKIARDEKRTAVDDDKLLAGLRRSLGWKIASMHGDVVFTIAEIVDHGALPHVVALLPACPPEDGHLLWQIAKAVVKLEGAKAADVAKLKAARARMRSASYESYVDKLIAKLEKRVR